MAINQLAYMSREEAERWFIRQHADVLAGTDNAAKRKAWATCIDTLIKENGVHPKHGRSWMYNRDFDNYKPATK